MTDTKISIPGLFKKSIGFDERFVRFKNKTLAYDRITTLRIHSILRYNHGVFSGQQFVVVIGAHNQRIALKMTGRKHLLETTKVFESLNNACKVHIIPVLIRQLADRVAANGAVKIGSIVLNRSGVLKRGLFGQQSMSWDQFSGCIFEAGRVVLLRNGQPFARIPLSKDNACLLPELTAVLAATALGKPVPNFVTTTEVVPSTTGGFDQPAAELAKLTANRSVYKPSGRFSVPKMLLATSALLAATVVLALTLDWLTAAGYYWFIVMPFFAAAILCGLGYKLFLWAHCRSPRLGQLLMVLVGLAMYLGYYYVGFLKEVGPDCWDRADLLPKYVAYRMENQTIRDTHSYSSSGYRSPAFSWLFFAVEFLICCCGGAVIPKVLQRAYDENTGRWYQRVQLNFPFGSSDALLTALINNRPPQLQASSSYGQGPHTAVQVEYLPDDEQTFVTVVEATNGVTADLAAGKRQLTKVAFLKSDIRSAWPWFQLG